VILVSSGMYTQQLPTDDPNTATAPTGAPPPTRVANEFRSP
jgi:hypothetical protein